VRKGFKSLFLLPFILASSDAHSQGVPLPLVGGGPPSGAPLASSPPKIPNNWKLVSGGRDPLTDRVSRYVITLPKTSSTVNNNSAAAELAIECWIAATGEIQPPSFWIRFTSLSGAVRRYKKLYLQYRADDGPVHGDERPVGLLKNGDRELYVDDVTKIGDAKRLRIEVEFHSAGTAFFDFNISGATEAAKSVACR
jgi:hypothetical protein